MKMTLREKINYICEVATSPRAYSVYACVGLVVTVVCAIVATKEVCEAEAEKSPEEKNDISKLDQVLEIGAAYSSTALAAAATIYCIHKADAGWRDYTGLISTGLSMTQDKMARYRSQAPGLVAASLVSGLGGRKADDGKQWYCLKDLGPYNDIYFQSTEADIYYAELHLNRNFQLRGSASVREFAAFLGILDQIDKEADYYGWDIATFIEDWGMDPWIDFEHWHTTDPETGETINMISFTWEPEFNEDHDLLAYGYLPYPGE